MDAYSPLRLVGFRRCFYCHQLSFIPSCRSDFFCRCCGEWNSFDRSGDYSRTKWRIMRSTGNNSIEHEDDEDGEEDDEEEEENGHNNLRFRNAVKASAAFVSAQWRALRQFDWSSIADSAFAQFSTRFALCNQCSRLQHEYLLALRASSSSSSSSDMSVLVGGLCWNCRDGVLAEVRRKDAVIQNSLSPFQTTMRRTAKKLTDWTTRRADLFRNPSLRTFYCLRGLQMLLTTALLACSMTFCNQSIVLQRSSTTSSSIDVSSDPIYSDLSSTASTSLFDSETHCDTSKASDTWHNCVPQGDSDNNDSAKWLFSTVVGGSHALVNCLCAAEHSIGTVVHSGYRWLTATSTNATEPHYDAAAGDFTSKDSAFQFSALVSVSSLYSALFLISVLELLTSFTLPVVPSSNVSARRIRSSYVNIVVWYLTIFLSAAFLPVFWLFSSFAFAPAEHFIALCARMNVAYLCQDRTITTLNVLHGAVLCLALVSLATRLLILQLIMNSGDRLRRVKQSKAAGLARAVYLHEADSSASSPSSIGSVVAHSSAGSALAHSSGFSPAQPPSSWRPATSGAASAPRSESPPMYPRIAPPTVSLRQRWVPLGLTSNVLDKHSAFLPSQFADDQSARAVSGYIQSQQYRPEAIDNAANDDMNIEELVGFSSSSPYLPPIVTSSASASGFAMSGSYKDNAAPASMPNSSQLPFPAQYSASPLDLFPASFRPAIDTIDDQQQYHDHMRARGVVPPYARSSARY